MGMSSSYPIMAGLSLSCELKVFSRSETCYLSPRRINRASTVGSLPRNAL